MSLAYLLDEHLRGPLWWAIQRHNALNVNVFDVVRVGDSDGPPLGATDPDILHWTEQFGRVLVTLDEHTIPGHLTAHLRAGNHSPGVFTMRPGSYLPVIVEFLLVAAYASEPEEWVDRIV